MRTHLSSLEAYFIGNRWLTNLVLAALYFQIARWSLLLAFPGSNASPVWPPSGIALAAILLLGFRLWPAIFLGAFLANILVLTSNLTTWGFTTVFSSLLIAVGNTTEALAAAWMIKRLNSTSGILSYPQDIFKFTTSALLASAIAASFGVFSLQIAGFLPENFIAKIWMNWWLGDIAGIIVITPLILVWFTKSLTLPQRVSTFEIVATILLTLGLILITFNGYLSSNHYDRLILILLIAIIFWIAHRYHHTGVTLTTLVISAVAVWSTTHGLGPFSTAELNHALILLVSFIAIVALLGLVLASDDYQNTAERGFLPTSWFTLYIALSLTIFVWHLISLDTESKAQSKFDTQVAEIENLIEQRIKVYEALLKSGIGLLSASKNVEREEWQKFITKLDIIKNFPGVQGVGYAKYIQDKDKGLFVQNTKKEYLIEYKIFPDGKRDEYVVVHYLEPLNWRNKRAIGYDMFSETNRRNAIQESRDTGQAIITSKVILVQETNKDVQPGFLMYVPFYLDGAQPNSVEKRRSVLEGYVYAPFRSHDFIQKVIENKFQDLNLEVFDGTTIKPEYLLYTAKQSETVKSPVYSYKKNLQLKVSNRIWTLQIISKPSFDKSIDRSKEQIILITGFLISLLLFMQLRDLAISQQSADLLAKQMAGAFKEAEAKFGSLAESSNEGIFVTESDGTIIFCNKAAGHIFMYSPQDLISQNINLVLPELFLINPSLNKLENQAATLGCISEISGQTKNGVKVPLSISLCTWGNDQQKLYGAIVHDISEQQLQKLKLQNSLTEKETLLKEVYHRVKNNLQVVTSMFNLQTRILPEGQAREVLMQAASRVYSMSLVHEKLYRSKNLASIDLHEYIHDLCKHFSEASALEERGIRFVLSLQHIDVDLDTAIPLGLIINELISNSIKHAFKDRMEGTVAIALSKASGNQAELIVTDDGPGLVNSSETKGTTLGLKLVDSLCRQLDAEKTTESTDGMKTCLRFNLKSQRSQF